VAYEDIDVLTHATARDELIRLTGGTAIPVVVVDGQVVVGFDRPKLQRLLAI
jgi:glutaredoxin 3